MSTEENNIKLLQMTSYVSGMFTLFVALIMIFGYIQLETIKPLENPSLISLKEQYDGNPNNEDMKEQVRALDLMARKAFFSTRWQIETGTYLLLAGALIFVICQRLIISTKKKIPKIPGAEYDITGSKRKTRIFLLISSIIIIALAFIISFLLRKNLPDPLPVPEEIINEGISSTITIPANQAIILQQEVSGEQELVIMDEAETGTTGEEPAKESSVSTIADASKEYPFFRGDGSKGVVEDISYPTEWDGKTGQNIEWMVKIPQHGYSSPVIWGNRIFLTGAEGAATEVMCFNKISGELMWSAPATGIEGEPAESPKTSEDTGLAAPTAATNGKFVCAIFGTGNLVCLDFDGKRVWAKNIGVPDNHYGHSSSLIIHGDKLLVQYDHYRKKSLLAFDINSGNQIWETVRPVAMSWASPVIAEFDGVDQVILTADPSVISYDVNTGEVLWSVKCMSGEVGPSVGVNSKYVFAVNDFAKLVAISPGEPAAIVWEDNEYTPEVSSPVATDELVFVLTSYGAVACYDAENGDLVWDHDFDYGFYASPILAGNKVYMLDQAGVMHIVKAEREFSLIAESPLGERAVCTPAFSEGKIYLRSEEHLYCISN